MAKLLNVRLVALRKDVKVGLSLQLSENRSYLPGGGQQDEGWQALPNVGSSVDFHVYVQKQ